MESSLSSSLTGLFFFPVLPLEVTDIFLYIFFPPFEFMLFLTLPLLKSYFFLERRSL
jgi:hypothetical protein